MDWILVRDVGLWLLLFICWVQLLWIRSLRKRVRELEWFRQSYWAQTSQNQGWQYRKW